MTARHRRQMFGRPRRPKTITTYGVHVLDNSREEVMPRYHRDANVDDPWLGPNKSEAVRALLILLAGAQAHVPDTPEVKWRLTATSQSDLDMRWFLDDAKLTEKQIEVLMLTGEGRTVREIAKFLGVNRMTVGEHLRKGRHKLIRQIPPIDAFKVVMSDPDEYVRAVLADPPGTARSPIPMPTRGQAPRAREYIRQRIAIDEFGCWVWKGMRNQGGYGLTSLTFNQALSHRVSYHVFVEPILAGLVIDHRC